jgi:competence protein ComEC
MKKSTAKRLSKLPAPFLIIIIALAIVFAACQHFRTDDAPPAVADSAEFHFIDVGQGDAVLIRTPAGDVLIDAGKNSSEEALDLYLKSQGVKTIEYAIFTHPHEDHIGGADMVIKNYDIKNVILPNCPSTTKTYTNMLTAISQKNLTAKEAHSGDKYRVGELVLNILGPVRNDYKEVNDHSVVILAEWGGTRVMLAGDAELEAENDILKKFGNSNIDCNILKLGHHGSSSSSGEKWLKALSPDIGIICCGKDNEYGHPHSEIVERLSKFGIKSYRTDELGSLVFVSDGKTVSQKDN